MKSQIEKIYDFTEAIEWLGEYPVDMPNKKITANLAANFKQQFALYDAFEETYLTPESKEKPHFNKDVAAQHMLDAQKRMILINKKAHSILNPTIKTPSLELQLKEFLKSKPELWKFIKENLNNKK